MSNLSSNTSLSDSKIGSRKVSGESGVGAGVSAEDGLAESSSDFPESEPFYDIVGRLTGFSNRLKVEQEKLWASDDLTDYNQGDLKYILSDVCRLLEQSQAGTRQLVTGTQELRKVIGRLKEKIAGSANNNNCDANSDEELLNEARRALATANVELAEAIRLAAEVGSAAAEATVESNSAQKEAEELENSLVENERNDEKNEKLSFSSEELDIKETRSEGETDDTPDEEGLILEEGSRESVNNVQINGKRPSSTEGTEQHGNEMSDKEEESGIEKEMLLKAEDENESDNKEPTEPEEDYNSDNVDFHDSDVSSEGIPDNEVYPTNNRDPSDWHTFRLWVENEEYEQEIACVIKSQRKVLEELLNVKFTNDIGPTALLENEEMVSDVVSLSMDAGKLRETIHLALPYTSNHRINTSREVVVKVSKDGQSWKVLPTETFETTLDDHRVSFAEVKVDYLAHYVVVARLVRDKTIVSKKGCTLKSSVENRLSITYPNGACLLTNVQVQVQHIELTTVSELKARLRSTCAGLLAASPIVHLEHSSSKKFGKPAEVIMPCPPSPNRRSGPSINQSTAGRPSTASLPSVNSSRNVGTQRPKSARFSLYGADDCEDTLYVMYREKGSDNWEVLTNSQVKQLKKDTVSFSLKRPVERLMVMRVVSDSGISLETAARCLEDFLKVRYVSIILHHRLDNPEQVMVQAVPYRGLDSAQRKLIDQGFEGPPDPSEEIPMTEGQIINIRFTGNLKLQTEEDKQLTLPFFAHRRNAITFYIQEDNKYGNHSSPFYRGMGEFYGKPAVSLEDKDEDDIYLDGDEKERKLLREVRARNRAENKDLLCKLPVELPKAEIEPHRPPSRYRSLTGPTDNNCFQWLASELGNEWELVASYLGIKRNRIQSIRRNNPNNSEQQIFDMLITWRSNQPKSASKLAKLARALVKSGRYELADELKSKMYAS